MSRTRISQALLVLMFLVFVAGEYVSFHDIYGIPFLLAAVGSVVLARSWKGWVIAAAFVGVALYWSSAEQHGCSFWWRSRYVVDKSLGRLPYVSWDDVRYAAFDKGHCFYPKLEHRWIVDSIKLLDTEIIDGHEYRQFKTDLGKLLDRRRKRRRGAGRRRGRTGRPGVAALGSECLRVLPRSRRHDSARRYRRRRGSACGCLHALRLETGRGQGDLHRTGSGEYPVPRAELC